MKINELRAMTDSQLKMALSTALQTQFNLKMQHATRRLVATHKLTIARRQIARLYTILTEHESQRA